MSVNLSLDRIKARALRQMAVRSNVVYGANFHVGPGSVVWAPVSLAIGDNVYVGKHVTIEVDGVVGDEVLFANGSGVVGKTDHDYRQVGKAVRSSDWVGDHPDRLSTPVVIGSDVWVGFNAVVQSGLTIGDTCVIAAGSVVTTSVPPNSIVAGVPARVLRNRFSDDDLRRHWEILAGRGVRLRRECTHGRIGNE
jgi:acetyltransferase-like isoleucine patch superfamily enzyme